MAVDGSPELRPGHFYWVRPVVDPEAHVTPSPEVPIEEMVSHWSNGDQPGRFDGSDESGVPVWTLLGRRTPVSRMEWIGDEILKPSLAAETAQAGTSEPAPQPSISSASSS